MRVPSLKIFIPREQKPQFGPPFYEWTFPNGNRAAEFYRIASGYLLRFPGLADFEVGTQEKDVFCFPALGINDATPEHLFRNQVLPVLLGNAGNYVFHGGAVEIGGDAVVFIGHSGRGKSTLVASFASNGCALLADDGLMLEFHNGVFHVVPGYPSVRLWSDSQEILSGTEVKRAPALQFTTKAQFLAGSILSYCDEQRLLRAAYFLGDGSARDIAFRKLSTAETLMGWAKHSFLLDVEDPSIMAGHFQRVAMLADKIVAYELDYPRQLEKLGSVREAIIQHATSEGANL